MHSIENSQKNKKKSNFMNFKSWIGYLLVENVFSLNNNSIFINNLLNIYVEYNKTSNKGLSLNYRML